MRPIKFKESNITFTGKVGIEDLPGYSDGIQCLSCWKMSIKEKLSLLIFGNVWLALKSGKTQPPVIMFCQREGFEQGDKNGT